MRTQSQMLKDYEAGMSIGISDDPDESIIEGFDPFDDDTGAVGFAPITWVQFKGFSENERRAYLGWLREEFGVNQQDISLWLTGSRSSLSSYLSTHGPKGCFSRNRHLYKQTEEQKQKWKEFIGAEDKMEEYEAPNETEEYESPDVPGIKDKLFIKGDGRLIAQILSAALAPGTEYSITIREFKEAK